MATTSYSNLFGTNGAGQQNTGNLFGQQARTQQTQQQQQQQAVSPQQTFAQLQQQGMARPAPATPQGQNFQRFGGSQQSQQARSAMLGQLQQQLAQPTRFNTQAFQQIRGAQAANLQQEYRSMQEQLQEQLARQGLSSSTIGYGRMGDLAGQQSRALADVDARLLQAAAETQAQDRLAAMQAGQQFAELAGSQDLSQFEANRVAQAAEFQQALQSAQFAQGQTEFARQQALAAAQASQSAGLQGTELALREKLGLGELTGQVNGQQTLAARQQAQQAADAAAERQLRTTLQSRELTAQEQQQLRDIQGRKDLLAQEQGLRREELTGRVQVGTQSVRQADGRVVQQPVYAGTLQARELEQQRQLQEAQLKGYFEGPNGTRIDTLASRQLSQDRLNALAEQAARQSQLSGVMYKVNAQGQLEVERDEAGRPVSAEARRQSLQDKAQTEMDRALRQRLGLTEATGVVFDAEGKPVIVGGQQLLTQPSLQAQQSLMVQLAGVLSGATVPPEGMAKFFSDLMAKFTPPGGASGQNPWADWAGPIGNQS